jgi:hypothetical protein
MWFWEPDSGEIEQGFDTQAEAEAWLTANFEDLRDIGISAVTLREEDRIVYGPMSLDPA